jgi:hypothetical protein
VVGLLAYYRYSRGFDSSTVQTFVCMTVTLSAAYVKCNKDNITDVTTTKSILTIVTACIFVLLLDRDKTRQYHECIVVCVGESTQFVTVSRLSL